MSRLRPPVKLWAVKFEDAILLIKAIDKKQALQKLAKWGIDPKQYDPEIKEVKFTHTGGKMPSGIATKCFRSRYGNTLHFY